MRRIFWDTMLLIYLLESHPSYSIRTPRTAGVCVSREGCATHVQLGCGRDTGGRYRDGQADMTGMRRDLDDLEFQYLPFDQSAEEPFARLRNMKVPIADAIHLACAASAGADLFLTGDRKLLKLKVPGIHFISNFDTELLW